MVKNRGKPIVGSIISIVLMLLISVTSFAELKATDIDETQNMSLTVTFEIDETALEGVQVTIYKVADLYTENYGVFYTPLVGDYDYEGLTAEESNELAAELAEKVDDDVESYIGTTAENGSVTFSSLSQGMYLVVLSEGYYSDDLTQYIFDPYLVSVPLAEEEDGMYGWVYEVESIPKTTTSIAGENPKTGDESMFMGYLAIASLSALALGITIKKKRRLNEKI